jgi:hypothetical protein
MVSVLVNREFARCKMAMAEILITAALVIAAYLIYPYLHDAIYRRR